MKSFFSNLFMHGWRVKGLADGVDPQDAVTVSQLDAAVVPAGSDSQVQYNNGGAFGGSSNMTWDDVSYIFKIDGFFDFYNGIRGVRMRQSETSGSTRTLLFQGAGDNPAMTGFRILPGIGSEATNGYKTLFEQYAHLNGANYTRLFMLSLYGDGTYGTRHVIASDNSGATAASICFRTGSGVWDTLPDVLVLDTNSLVQFYRHGTFNPYGTGAGNTSELRFAELAANGSHYVGFKAKDSIAANKIWVLPGADGSDKQFLQTDGAGNLTFASAKIKAVHVVQMMVGTKPGGTGGDIVFKLPRGNSGASVEWTLKRLFFRAETPSAGTTSIRLEYYQGTGAFSATNAMSGGDLSLSGAGTYETSASSFSKATLNSDDKYRLNFTALDGTHDDFLIEMEFEEA